MLGEALRMRLCYSLYIGGVHWLTVGQLTDNKGKVDKGELLDSLMCIINRLDMEKAYQPKSIKAAADHLQKVRKVIADISCVVLCAIPAGDIRAIS